MNKIEALVVLLAYFLLKIMSEVRNKLSKYIKFDHFYYHDLLIRISTELYSVELIACAF